MPSRKQRRRREKLKRHEYEYVVETEDGEVVPLEKPRERDKEDAKSGRGAAPRDRRGREVPKPSLQRVLKRTAIFAPLLLVLVYITQGDRLTPVQMVFNVVVLLVFFIPFSYMVDVFVYRMVMRRQRRESERRRGGES